MYPVVVVPDNVVRLETHEPCLLCGAARHCRHRDDNITQPERDLKRQVLARHEAEELRTLAKIERELGIR
jgi:hypothetical protein